MKPSPEYIMFVHIFYPDVLQIELIYKMVILLHFFCAAAIGLCMLHAGQSKFLWIQVKQMTQVTKTTQNINE